MTDRNRISRRSSLKRIAATGTILGSLTVSVGTAVAGEDEDTPDVRIEGVCYEGKEKKDGKYHDLHGKFRVHNESDDDLKLLWKEGHGKKKSKITSTSKGWIHVDAGDSETVWIDLGGDHTKKVYLYHDGEKVDWASVDEMDSCEIHYVKEHTHLEAVCYEPYEKDGHKKGGKDHRKVLFRVENHGEHDMKYAWKEGHGKKNKKITSTSKGWVHVDAGDSETFWVDVNGDHRKKISLYYDGEMVAYAKADVDERCSAH